MNKCPKCGTKGDVMFCPECGTKMIEENGQSEGSTKNKVCSKCGYEGDYAFCPECGGEMIDAPTEEDRKNGSYENAIKRVEEKTIEAYKLAITELEKLGDWKDAPELVEKYKEELAEIERVEAEQKAESEKQSIYEKANSKFEQKTSKAFKAGIADLEKLGEWKDAAEIVEQRKIELKEIEEAENKKKAALKKKIIIGLAAVVAIIIGSVIVKTVTTPDLTKYSATKDATINSMSYKIPEECKLEDSNDTFAQYSLSKGDKVIGVIEVEYRGETDLNGDAGYDSESAEHKSTDSALKLIPDGAGKYQEVEADNSAFEVTVYCNEEKVKGGSEFLSAIAQTFDVSGYKNPRTSKGIDASYTGDAAAGVTIKEGIDGLTVSETFETALGTGSKNVSYTIEKPVELKSGETSKVHIKADGQECTLSVEGKKSYKEVAAEIEKEVMNSEYAKSELFDRFEVAYDWYEDGKEVEFSIRSRMERNSYAYIRMAQSGSDAALAWETILLKMSNYCSDLKKEFAAEGYDASVTFHVWAPGEWKGQRAYSFVSDEGIQVNPFVN